MIDNRIEKGRIVYYAQILEPCGIFELLELKVRTVEDNWFAAVEDKRKHVYLFYNKAIGKEIFFDRKEALDIVKNAEENCKRKFSDEKCYEEY